MPELEDELADIVSKAQRGLAISTSQLAKLSQLDPAAVRSTRSGTPSLEVIHAIAPHLRLKASALWNLYKGRHLPAREHVNGLVRIDTPAPMTGYEEMRVSAFLLHHPESKEAILFDTGTRLKALTDVLERAKLELKALFVTHTHWDHIDILEELTTHFPQLAVYGPPLSNIPAQTTLSGNETIKVSGLEITAKPTPGHAPDGLSYLVKGLEKPIVIVGDAIFAGSVGGMAAEAYPRGLTAIKEHLLSLPPETIIAPGHGGLTSVGYEREHNPFF